MVIFMVGEKIYNIKPNNIICQTLKLIIILLIFLHGLTKLFICLFFIISIYKKQTNRFSIENIGVVL